MPVKAILLLLLSLFLAAPVWAADEQNGNGDQSTATEQGEKGKQPAGDGEEEEEPECD